ncbi:MAG: hypothetical protein KBG91_02400 [Syntrophomonadaceae bacterium]|nr:hypothetical protein [Syntrophomonadaceae bacterium]
MKRLYKGKCLLCLLIVFTLVLGANVSPVTAQQEQRPLEQIFIISVDGLSYEGFVSVPVNNMKHIAGEGVSDAKSMALKVDTIEAAEASLITGALPEDHRHVTAKSKIETESLFEIIRKLGKSYVVIDGSGGKLKSFEDRDKAYFSCDNADSDEKVLEQALAVFNKQKPFLTYIYLNDCRSALLTLDDKAYYETVRSFDLALGTFINSLRKQDNYYNSLIIVTSPRSSSPSNKVPLIMQGPGLKTNTCISNTMITDVVPTICSLLKVENPTGNRGIAAHDALLLSYEEQQKSLNKWARSLKSDRIAAWSKYFELQDTLYQTIYQMTAIKEEKQSIFNFMGEKEQTINKIKGQMRAERIIYLGIFILMLLGYGAEYKLLKRKFMLFK